MRVRRLRKIGGGGGRVRVRVKMKRKGAICNDRPGIEIGIRVMPGSCHELLVV
jgi:hypothetical protein